MAVIAVFPGQGAQAVGMGSALAAASPAARRLFEEVDEALGEKLSALIFEGPADRLTLTANAQPALMATSLAAVRALEERLGGRLADRLDYVAGHSLGEYSALAAAGSIAVADAARLLRLRGEAMQDAVPAGEGAMAAVLGLGPDAAMAVADAAAADGGVCQLANDNADGQAVLSGSKEAVERAVAIAKERGAKRVVLLQVSAPFHCALMAPAADRLERALADVRFAAPAVPLIANVTAEPVADPASLPGLLVRQATSRVRWRESMATMGRLGVATILELGAGKVLTGLAKRAVPGATLLNLAEPADLDAVAAALS
ncbi:MAG TPA: ACP S-malonyltransferase [Geminicoccus sp.]|uniref:ACP S-malonyltransferase n=2 Tax=Geminicoccus TaxID=489140 RepID=UPI002CA91F84|nr:ACP S-malonyltransferase [Geminicoccus sp.]HWL71685.1 ACP S-malonyltransferase [Geminicoccus sp.]